MRVYVHIPCGFCLVCVARTCMCKCLGMHVCLGVSVYFCMRAYALLVCIMHVRTFCLCLCVFLVCALGRYFVRYFIFTACVTMRAHSFTFFTCLSAYFLYVFFLCVMLMYLSARKWGCNSLAYEYIQILETWFLQKLTALRLMCPNAHLSKCGSWLFRSTAISPRSLWSFRWRKLMLGFTSPLATAAPFARTVKLCPFFPKLGLAKFPHGIHDKPWEEGEGLLPEAQRRTARFGLRSD